MYRFCLGQPDICVQLWSRKGGLFCDCYPQIQTNDYKLPQYNLRGKQDGHLDIGAESNRKYTQKLCLLNIWERFEPIPHISPVTLTGVA